MRAVHAVQDRFEQQPDARPQRGDDDARSGRGRPVRGREDLRAVRGQHHVDPQQSEGHQHPGRNDDDPRGGVIDDRQYALAEQEADGHRLASDPVAQPAGERVAQNGERTRAERQHPDAARGPAVHVLQVLRPEQVGRRLGDRHDEQYAGHGQQPPRVHAQQVHDGLPDRDCLPAAVVLAGETGRLRQAATQIRQQEQRPQPHQIQPAPTVFEVADEREQDGGQSRAARLNGGERADAPAAYVRVEFLGDHHDGQQRFGHRERAREELQGDERLRVGRERGRAGQHGIGQNREQQHAPAAEAVRGQGHGERGQGAEADDRGDVAELVFGNPQPGLNLLERQREQIDVVRLEEPSGRDQPQHAPLAAGEFRRVAQKPRGP